MPNNDGYETIREIRSFTPAIPIIAMSSGSRHGMIDPLPLAKNLGAVSLLRKPFSVDELEFALANALDGRIF
jgi:CheY-like chemotaxis protein